MAISSSDCRRRAWALGLATSLVFAMPPAGHADGEGPVKLTGAIATVLKGGEPCFYAAHPEPFAKWGPAQITGMRIVETEAAPDPGADQLAARPQKRASFHVRAARGQAAEAVPSDPKHCLPLGRFAGNGPDHVTVGAFYSVRVMGRFSDGDVGLFFGNFTVGKGFLGALKVEDLNPAAPRR